MGGDKWGSGGVPVSTTNIYNAYNGLTAEGEFGLAVYPTYNMREAIQAAWASGVHPSPYENVVLHDPNPDLDYALARFEDYDAIVQALAPTTDWNAILTAVVAYIDASVTWTATVNDLVTARDLAQIPETMRAQARMNAAVANNGGGGYAFSMVRAIVESAHQHDLDAFRTQLTVDRENQRRQMILQAMGQIIQLMAMQHDGQVKAVAFRMDLAKQNIVANNDLIANQMNLDVQAENWNIGLLGHIKSVDVMGGAPIVPATTPGWYNAVGGIANIAGAFLGLGSSGVGIASMLQPLLGGANTSNTNTPAPTVNTTSAPTQQIQSYNNLASATIR